MWAKDFIPECYIDTNLVETLLQLKGVALKGVNHQKGCNNVANSMLECCSEFAIGIIDSDKRQHSYTLQFQEVASSEHITFMSHPDRHHFIIMIKPAMDSFILSAEEMSIDVSALGFSYELKEFTKITKSVTSKSDVKFKSLFKRIQDAKEIRILSGILHYLHEHRYDYNLEYLKQLFK